MQQNSRVIYVLIPCLFKWFDVITCNTSNVCMFIDRQLSGLYEGHRLFNLYICVGIILLTSKKFIDVCVAGKRYRLVTLIHCQELVSFTSSCVIKYGAKTG